MKILICSLVLSLGGALSWAADGGKVPAHLLNTLPYKNTPEAALQRGEIVYQHYCVLCHGTSADGKGRAARIYNPPPANLVLSDKNDQYKELIIRRGGAALARSQFMPPWGDELTDEQITDVVTYLRSIQKNKPPE